MTTMLLIIKAIGAGIAQDLRTYFRNTFGYFAAVSAYVDALAVSPSEGDVSDAELTRPWVPLEVPDSPLTEDGQGSRPMLIVPMPGMPQPRVRAEEHVQPFAPGGWYEGLHRSLVHEADRLAQRAKGGRDE